MNTHLVLPYLLRWGCSHEADTLEAYKQHYSAIHTNLAIQNAGLCLSMERPYMGASPDGFVTCDCCGKGCIEVKCPNCHKEGIPDNEDKNFYMKRNEEGM